MTYATNQLPFEPFPQFTRNEQLKRRVLVKRLVELIWSPQRLREAARY